MRPVLGQGPKFSVLVLGKKKIKKIRKSIIFARVPRLSGEFVLKMPLFFFAIKPMGHESKLIIFFILKRAK